VKLSYNDSFSEKLLENEMKFNDKLASLIPEHHGRQDLARVCVHLKICIDPGCRRWASFIGSCSLQRPKSDFPSTLSTARALVFKREQGTPIVFFPQQRWIHGNVSIPDCCSLATVMVASRSPLSRSDGRGVPVAPDSGPGAGTGDQPGVAWP
jgi:hypothetical protein